MLSDLQSLYGERVLSLISSAHQDRALTCQEAGSHKCIYVTHRTEAPSKHLSCYSSSVNGIHTLGLEQYYKRMEFRVVTVRGAGGAEGGEQTLISSVIQNSN